jgi:hypothetical protein
MREPFKRFLCAMDHTIAIEEILDNNRQQTLVTILKIIKDGML